MDEKERNAADEDNPVTAVRHLTQHGVGHCLGLMVMLWCPGCQSLHTPRFRCPEHGGPPRGPVWEGDPYSDPFSMEPSLLVPRTGVSPRCHSYVQNGEWRYLRDCEHVFADRTIPLPRLPNWLMRDMPGD